MSANWTPPVQRGVSLREYRPAAGDHLCSLWTDPVADREAGRAFLDAAGPHEHRVWVQDRSRGTDATAGGPRLARYTTDQVHLAKGLFDPERMRRFWTDRATEAAAAGAPHVRVVAEMAWALRGVPGTDEAPLYESSLNPHLSSLPVSVICQYGSARFGAEMILATVLSHPLVVVGEMVFPNPFAVDHARFPERFESLRADPRAALVPVWTHFLHRLQSANEVAAFLCNSLPALVDGERVWVWLRGMAEPLAVEVEADRVTPAHPAAWQILDRQGRLYALWPGTGQRAGGSVQVGTAGDLEALEARYHRGLGRVVVTRTRAFARGDVTRFVSLAAAVGDLLASGPGHPGTGDDAAARGGA